MLYESQYYGVCFMPDLELVHHGILGQKWGKKNGPPYPLGPSDHSAREKKAGWRKSLRKSSSPGSSRPKRQGLSDKQKKALKIAGAAAVVGLAAYGAYKYGAFDGIDLKVPVSKLPGDSGAIENLKVDELGIKLIDEPMSDRQHELVANPSHDQHNCKQVSMAIAERIANGRDFVAKPKSFSGNLHEFIDKYYEEGNAAVGSITCDGTNAKDRLEKQLLRKYSDGDVGCVSFDFKKKYLANDAMESGHCFNWKIENRSVIYLDGQGDSSGSIKDPTKFFKYKDPNTELEYVKITGLTLVKENYRDVVEERKS